MIWRYIINWWKAPSRDKRFLRCMDAMHSVAYDQPEPEHNIVDMRQLADYANAIADALEAKVRATRH